MKKSLFLFLFVLLAGEGFCQRFIPRVGLTLSTISFSHPDVDDKVKSGFVLGLGFETASKNNVFLQPEINIAQKGINFRYQQEMDVKLTIYYLDILLPVKFKFNANRRNERLYLLGGPAFGVGLGGRYHTSENKNSIVFGHFKGGDDYKYLAYVDNRLDLGLQLGTGVEFGDRFTVEARYTYGLTNLYTTKNRSNSQWPISLVENSKNRVWQLSFGCLLKKKQNDSSAK